MAGPLQLGDLADSLLRTSALTEFALVVGCLGLAWSTVRLMRGSQVRAASVLFGERIVDGALFPVLALAAVVAARALLPWLGVPEALFRLAVPVLVSLAAIRLTVRVLGAAFPASPTIRAIERTVWWLAWVAVALWVTGLLPVMLAELDRFEWNFGASRISLRNLLEGALSAVVVLMLALWLSAVIEAQLMKRAGSTDLSMRKIAANAVRALLLFVALMLALSAAGIDLTALGVLGGAIGVGLGFGLQKIAANYVSGFVILAERSLRIGDMVKVDNFEGRVTDIRTRYTVIRSLGGREALVPNEQLITQRVENLSFADTRLLITTNLQVAYGSDVQALQPKLVAAMRAVPRVMQDPPPTAHLTLFAADGLELALNFWIDDPQNGQGNVRSEVNLAVLRVLDEEGVQIPFPQRVLHVPPGEALQMPRRASTVAETSLRM